MSNFRQGTELQTILVTDVDPTVGAGIPGGTPNLLLIRTDNNTLYYYDGPLDTDWRLITNGGAEVVSYVAVSANYAVTSTDNVINCTANTFTVTLPTAVGITGKIYSIKNSGVGTITVDAFGAQTIDGVLTANILAGVALTLVSTGSDWIII